MDTTTTLEVFLAEEVGAEPVLLAGWEVRSLHHARQERPPLVYLVDKLIPLPSLTIVYGAPGSLKSMLLSDLCCCVAAGTPWLAPMPGDSVKPGLTLNTTQAPVLWIDYDNGVRYVDERFDALSKAHGLSPDDPVYYVSMQKPKLDASNDEMVEDLAKLIRRCGAKLVVIDNLGLVSGDVDENSNKMGQVLMNLRWLAETLQIAIIVVHHQRKSSGGTSDKSVRKGETLRGHSSIEASLDLALLVERLSDEKSVVIIPTKVRRFVSLGDKKALGAYWTYDHIPGTTELAEARFFSLEVMTKEEEAVQGIRHAIIGVLKEQNDLSQKELVDAVRDKIAAKAGSAPGINRIRGIAKQMAKDGDIVADGKGTKVTYRLL